MSTGHEDLNKVIEAAGYSYDPIQDIFYSTMDPWQRDVGYCHLYDEAAAPLGMIIDCEPIYFDYKGKKWMISFWKGQYGMVTGGEIGIYIATREITLQGIFSGTFYQAPSNEDCLSMSYTLKKNDKTLFTRSENHWWLTGFKLGEFSEPLELTMDIRITLKDVPMRDAFITGLLNAGYSYKDLDISGPSVGLTFDIPHAPQPMTRTPETDKLIQRRNRLLCEQYHELTEPYATVPEKIKALEDLSPVMYKKVMKIGKTKGMYEMYTSIVIIGTFLISRLAEGIGKTKQLLR